jgi:MYXO-CTERM domain-containing protein
MKMLSKTLVLSALGSVWVSLPQPAAARDNSPNPGPASRPPGWCGTPGPVVPCTSRIGDTGPQPRRTLFLNRNGGAYSNALLTDSTMNTIGTSGPAAVIIQPGVIPPYPGNDTQWAEVVSCVKTFFAEYNVDVVDAEPEPSRKYVEIVVGGRQTDLNYVSPIGAVWGVASNDVFCNVSDKGVAFAFAADHPPQSQLYGRTALCETIAHEAGHVYGLEHEVLKEDLMSYEQYDPKDFMNVQSKCGEYETGPHACSCGTEGTQNSHSKLMDLVGPNDLVPPTGKVLTPGEGAKVPPAFKVDVEAADNVSVDKVELMVDGTLASADLAPPYSLRAPSNVSLGSHQVEVVIWDKSANTLALVFSVTVEPACSGANTGCGANEVCIEGACLGDIGHDCKSPADCSTGLCAAGDNFEKFCTRACEPAASDCPAGFACEKPSVGAARCVAAEGGSGLCAVGEHGSRRPWFFGLLAFLAVALAVRRQRSSGREPFHKE